MMREKIILVTGNLDVSKELEGYSRSFSLWELIGESSVILMGSFSITPYVIEEKYCEELEKMLEELNMKPIKAQVKKLKMRIYRLPLLYWLWFVQLVRFFAEG